MNKHHDLINIFASNKRDAIKKTIIFLNSYEKQKINIIAIEGTNNHYEVEVQYYDNYSECAIFETKDYKELTEKDIATLKYTL